MISIGKVHRLLPDDWSIIINLELGDNDIHLFKKNEEVLFLNKNEILLFLEDKLIKAITYAWQVKAGIRDLEVTIEDSSQSEA